MEEERFVNFDDLIGITHTYRLIDIQAIGVGITQAQQSYVRAFGEPLLVEREEAIRVREIWMRAG